MAIILDPRIRSFNEYCKIKKWLQRKFEQGQENTALPDRKHRLLVPKKPTECPECKAKHSFWVKGYYFRWVVEDELAEVLPVPRYICSSCSQIVSVLFAFLVPYRHFTARMISQAIQDYTSTRTYSKIQTKIVERDALCAALKGMGYANIEVHEQPQGLYGYKGDLRPEKAEVIVRRKFVGPASNDIGFKRKMDGTWEAIVSEYDQSFLGRDWVGRVCQKYAEHAVLAKLEEQGFSVSERDIDPVTKKIHLRLRRTS